MIKIAHIKMHFVFCQAVINIGSIKPKFPKLFFYFILIVNVSDCLYE